MTGSPISDMNPVLMAAGIKLNVCSIKRGFRTIKMDHSFFVGYRRNVISSNEVLLSIEIPYSTPVRLSIPAAYNICILYSLRILIQFKFIFFIIESVFCRL